MSVIRHQVPVTPAWAITDYKVQGSTYDTIIVDLHRVMPCLARLRDLERNDCATTILYKLTRYKDR